MQLQQRQQNSTNFIKLFLTNGAYTAHVIERYFEFLVTFMEKKKTLCIYVLLSILPCTVFTPAVQHVHSNESKVKRETCFLYSKHSHYD